MNKAHQIIDKISDYKAKELLELAVQEMNRKGFEYVDLDTADLDKEKVSQLTKPLLKELSTGEDMIAIYLRKQLIGNEAFLLNIEDDEEPYRNSAVEVASLLILLIPFLKAKWDVNVTVGKSSISFSGELGYLKEVISTTSTSTVNKNILMHSQLDAKGDIHVGDVINNYHGVNPIESSPVINSTSNENQSIKKELEQLITNGKIGKAIDQLLEYFEDRDEDLYRELILLAARHNKFRKQELLGLFSVEESRLEKNQITRALIEYLAEL